MKLLRLVFKNATRNRVRAILTVGGAAFLMWVLIFMMTALTEFTAWEGESATKTRVAVQHSSGLANFIPYELETYLRGDEIARHSSCVAKLNWFSGTYINQDPKNFFARFAVDHAVMREMWDEFKIPDDQYKAWCAMRTGCIAGAALAKKQDWKIGSKIPIQGDIFPCDLDLTLVATYTSSNPRDEQNLYFRWDYLDTLTSDRKLVGMYWLKARTMEDMPKLKELIDARTKNSSDPTETMTEKEFGAQFTAMMGNIKVLVAGLGSIVLLIMVLMTANTMAMIARERVTEIAVLRALGFTAPVILGLIIGESLILTVAGGGLALGSSLLLFNVAKLSPVPDFFPVFLVAPTTIAIALGASVACGLLSALVPAIRAANRTIVDGLRQVV